MKYKLIALDVDDTLLNSKNELTERTLSALRRAQEAGVAVVLATGRLPQIIKKLYDQIGLAGPIICGGGSVVCDKDFNEIFTRLLPVEDAHSILEFAHEAGVPAQMYFDGMVNYETENEFSIEYAKTYGFPPRVLPNIREMEVHSAKCLIVSTPEKIMEIQPKLKAMLPHLNVVRSKPSYLEITDPRANKGAALKFIGEYLGIGPEEMIAVGDSQIDVPMLKYAGLPVSVANGLEEIKPYCKYITKSNDEDGVACVIEKFILGE